MLHSEQMLVTWLWIFWITKICNTINSRPYLLKKLRRSLPHNFRAQFNHTLFFPHLLNCSTIRGNARQGLLDDLLWNPQQQRHLNTTTTITSTSIPSSPISPPLLLPHYLHHHHHHHHQKQQNQNKQHNFFIYENRCSWVLSFRYSFASASPDNIKQWKFPDGNFLQNLQGHNSIINCMAVNSDNVLVTGGTT